MTKKGKMIQEHLEELSEELLISHIVDNEKHVSSRNASL